MSGWIFPNIRIMWIFETEKAGVDFVMLRVGARGYGSGQIVLDDYS